MKYHCKTYFRVIPIDWRTSINRQNTGTSNGNNKRNTHRSTCCLLPGYWAKTPTSVAPKTRKIPENLGEIFDMFEGCDFVKQDSIPTATARSSRADDLTISHPAN